MNLMTMQWKPLNVIITFSYQPLNVIIVINYQPLNVIKFRRLAYKTQNIFFCDFLRSCALKLALNHYLFVIVVVALLFLLLKRRFFLNYMKKKLFEYLTCEFQFQQILSSLFLILSIYPLIQRFSTAGTRPGTGT